MAMFKSVMVYLGLGADEEYDDRYFNDDPYGDNDDPIVEDDSLGQPRSGRPATRTSEPMVGAASSQPSAVGAVRPLRAVPTDGAMNDDELVVRRLDTDESASGGVRPVPMQRSKPKTLSPQSFGDAKILADDFKRSVPVIMNLQGLDRDLARRLIDFASGVCYSLGGSMEKMAPQVFLITPRSVEVSDEDRRRIEERGFDRG